MKPLLDRLKSIEGYENTSKISSELLMNAQGDLDSEVSLSIKRVAPKINKLKLFEVMVASGKASRNGMLRILKALLRGGPRESLTDQIEKMSDAEIEDHFFEESQYWIKELYNLQEK